MTRKHFKYIADSLKATRPLDSSPASEADARRIQWNNDVLAMGSACRHFNANFKPGRFYEACGGLYDFSVRQSNTSYSLTGEYSKAA